jgi:hypothetical protein
MYNVLRLLAKRRKGGLEIPADEDAPLSSPEPPAQPD